MANLITNGDFESGTNGWLIATSPAEPAGVVAVTTTNSPFSSGSSALQMIDGAVDAGQSATKDFGAQANGKFNLSFDYKVTTTSNSYWRGSLCTSAGVGESFNFSIYQNSFYIGTTNVAAGLSTGTWYRVSMILDSAADKVLSGSITPFGGGSATTWGEIAGLATTAEIKRLVISDNNSTPVAPSIVLDNVSLSAIP